MSGERESKIRKNVLIARPELGKGMYEFLPNDPIPYKIKAEWVRVLNLESSSQSTKPEPVNPNYPLFYEGVGSWRK